MRHVRLLHACALVLMGGCADATTDTEARELRQFFADTTPATPEQRQRLNAAFASQAVRAWGYRRAGVRPDEAQGWSPVTSASASANGAEPGDVSRWLDAGDVTEGGLFAPCAQRACPEVKLSDEQHYELGLALNPADALERGLRVGGAALRLMGGQAEVRWVLGLETGLVLHPDEGFVEVNPRLLELVDSSHGSANREVPIASHSQPPARAQSVGAPSPSPLPVPSEPRPSASILRSHEPPPGHGSSSDCDCDCDVVDVRCSVQPVRSGGNRTVDLLGRQLLLMAGLLTLLLRRGARSRRPKSQGGRRPAWMLSLPILALGTLAQPADAEAPGGAVQLTTGKAHLARKQYAAAIRELEAARAAGEGREALEPLAQAYEGAGRLPEAYASLSELLIDATLLKKPELERIGRQIAALEARLAFIGVHVQPGTASLFVDGHTAVIDPRSRKLIVTAGPHHISARAEGLQEAGQTVLVQVAVRNPPLTLTLVAPPPAAPAPPPQSAPRTLADAPPRPARVYKYRQGLYVVGHVGFAFLTARPSGFHYETSFNEETNQERENPGLTSLFGATAGMRLTRGVGIGGFLMYARGGGEGTVQQFELTSGGGTLQHEGPADFTQQSVRLGPHFRFMAGGDRARFLAGTTLGGVYGWVDLKHVHVVESGGALLEAGTFEHEYSGLNPFWGFDLGAEFNVASHLLLGFAFDVLIDRTTNLSGNPFGGTAQGYVGFSARAGFHDWKPE